MTKQPETRMNSAQAAINNVAYDTLPKQNPSALGHDGEARQELFMVERKELRGNGQAPAMGHARTANQGNEAVARLETLRKRYHAAGKLIEAKAIARAIVVVRRGEE